MTIVNNWLLTIHIGYAYLLKMPFLSFLLVLYAIVQVSDTLADSAIHWI